MTRKEIAEKIAELALLRGEFTLRSGKKSHYYLDKYLFSTDPKVLAELGRLFAEHVTPDVSKLAGAELGGIPLVTATSLACGLPSIFIRNQKKTYGTSKQLEGRLEAKDRVLLVEDVCTTGGQILEAAQTITEQGAAVVKIVGTIDREEGARENIEAAGYTFASLFTKTELGV